MPIIGLQSGRCCQCRGTDCLSVVLTHRCKKKKTDLTQLLLATSFGPMYTHIDEYEWLSVEQTLILAGCNNNMFYNLVEAQKDTPQPQPQPHALAWWTSLPGRFPRPSLSGLRLPLALPATPNSFLSSVSAGRGSCSFRVTFFHSIFRLPQLQMQTFLLKQIFFPHEGIQKCFLEQ